MTISLPLAIPARRAAAIVLGSLLIAGACRPAPNDDVGDGGVVPQPGANGVALYAVPDEGEIRDSALLASVRRGRAILAATSDSLPDHVSARMACTSCHLDDGRRAGAMPWVGVYGRFPQYRSREAVVFRLEDRINGCMRRSMNGSPLPLEHPAMRDMVAYMSYLSRGVPGGQQVEGQGLRRLEPVLVGDETRGEALYAERCAVCHGANGEGTAVAPPLWGEGSFNVGAGMARLRTAAAFIRANMPFDRPGSLTDQEAFDVAAWMISRPRPDFAGKELDWPKGDAPPDAAYETLGKQRAAATRQ